MQKSIIDHPFFLFALLSVTFVCIWSPAFAQQIVPVPSDVKEELLRAATDEGDAEAMYITASLCFYGKKVKQDYKSAAHWLEKAADKGLVLAQYHLAIMNEEGKTIPQNDRKAFKWYGKAARQGLAQAQYKLGLMYKTGMGTPSNQVNAVWAIESAALQGHADAQNMTGKFTEEGKKLDLVGAYKWYVIATSSGSSEASKNRDSLRPYLTNRQAADAQLLARAFKPVKKVRMEELKTNIISRIQELK